MKGVTAEVSYGRSQESQEGLATARELVGKESADLWGRVKRLSVRDLANKFESGNAIANAAVAILAQEVILIGETHPFEVLLFQFEVFLRAMKSRCRLLTMYLTPAFGSQ